MKNALGWVVSAILLPVMIGGAPGTSAYALEGRITDRSSGAPLEGANVSLLGARRSVITDEQGNFAFRQLQIPGADEIVVNHPDYRTARLPLGTLGDGMWRLEITLVREAAAVGGDRPPERPAR